jgi:hypothetical protein
MAVLGHYQKIQISGFQALLFFILANPITFSVVDSLFMSVLGPYSSMRVTEEGTPTGFGLMLHAAVFFAVTLALMYV